jgi:hypothetical protein
MSALPDWITPPPPRGADLRLWQDWKQEIMTRSQALFLERNPWFTQRKEEIALHLGHRLPVPRLLHVSARDGRRPFSAVVAGLDLAALGRKLVLKGSLGASTKEVKVLDLAEWPARARCLLRREWHTPAELDAWIGDRDFVVEVALSCEREPIPRDFKVLVHRGEPRVVTVMDRNHAKTVVSMVDCRSGLKIPGNEIFPADYPRKWDEGRRLDDALAARVAVAAAFAPSVVRATNAEDLFVSIDTYVPADAPETVWLGEITTRSGSLHGNWLRRRFLEYLFLDRRF